MIDYKAAFEAVMTEYGVFEELCEHIEQECSCNRPQLERSESCICFSCGREFKVSEIIEWCDDDMTAICPHCAVDKVVAATSGIPQHPDFLAAFQMLYRRDSDGQLPFRSNERYVLIAHHPLRSSFGFVDEFEPDIANVVYYGVLEPGWHHYSDGDLPTGFWIYFQTYGDRTRVLYGLEGMLGVSEYLRDGVLHKVAVPICDAMESWDFVISRHPIDEDRMLDGCEHE